MAARLAPDNVRRMHQSLHHLVADAPWNDEEMLAQVQREVLPTMEKHSAVVAWIVDDTGFPKQGKHSVGGRPAVLRPSRQTGQLPGGGEFVGEHLEFELAHRLAALSAGGMVPGFRTPPAGRSSHRD